MIYNAQSLLSVAWGVGGPRVTTAPQWRPIMKVDTTSVTWIKCPFCGATITSSIHWVDEIGEIDVASAVIGYGRFGYGNIFEARLHVRRVNPVMNDPLLGH